jgi:hypothetical protein
MTTTRLPHATELDWDIATAYAAALTPADADGWQAAAMARDLMDELTDLLVFIAWSALCAQRVHLARCLAVRDEAAARPASEGQRWQLAGAAQGLSRDELSGLYVALGVPARPWPPSFGGLAGLTRGQVEAGERYVTRLKDMAAEWAA